MNGSPDMKRWFTKWLYFTCFSFHITLIKRIDTIWDINGMDIAFNKLFCASKYNKLESTMFWSICYLKHMSKFGWWAYKESLKVTSLWLFFNFTARSLRFYGQMQKLCGAHLNIFDSRSYCWLQLYLIKGAFQKRIYSLQQAFAIARDKRCSVLEKV